MDCRRKREREREREKESKRTEETKPCIAPTDLCNRHNLITDVQTDHLRNENLQRRSSFATFATIVHGLSREAVLCNVLEAPAIMSHRRVLYSL